MHHSLFSQCLTAISIAAMFISPSRAVPLSHFLTDSSPEVQTYLTVDSIPLTFAVFKPDGWKASDKRPAMVFIHGGAWTSGDGKCFYPHARYFNTRGAVTFSIEYRLEKQGGSSFANCFSDCKSAMRYIRGHAADFGINPDQIAVFGDSAGGHLSAVLGTCEGPDNPGDDLKISAVPNAMILCNPIVDMTEGNWIQHSIGGNALAKKPKPEDLIPTQDQTQAARALSPLFNIKSGQPPALLMHGTADKIVNPKQAQEFADADKSAGNRCDLIWMKDQGHAFVMVKYRASEEVVVTAITNADAFLGSLGWLQGPPTLEVSNPPAWTPANRVSMKNIYSFLVVGSLALLSHGEAIADPPARVIDATHSAFDLTPDAPTVVPPPQPLFEVRKYGAAGDGTTFDTGALQKAIDACAGSGGTVYLAGGKFLTAPLVLKGGMTFYINKDATLLGSTLPQDYPDKMPAQTAAQALRKSLLYADQADHLILDGGGEINGQGQLLPMKGKEPTRPSLIRIFGSSNVTVRNLTLRNPRMWTQVYSECSHLNIDHLKVFSPRGYCPNLDGMDICDSDHVTISNNFVDAQDDGICLKCHGPRGLQDITVRNNIITDYDANGIKLGTATHGPMTNIDIENNVVKSARFGGLCIESVDGAHVSGITVRGLEMTHVAQPIYIRLAHRDPLPNDLQFSNAVRTAAGSIDNILIENVRATQPDHKTAPSITITGIPDARLGKITIQNAYIEMPGGALVIPLTPPEKDGQYPQSNEFGLVPAYAIYVRHADHVVLDHVVVKAIKPDCRPWLAHDDATVETDGSRDLGQP